MSSVLLSEIVKEYLVTRSARCSAATVKNERLVLSRFVATVAGGHDPGPKPDAGACRELVQRAAG